MSSVCVFPGILPPHSDSHPLVSRYRAEQYEDVRGALVTMRFVNKATPLTELHLRMFQLENQMLLRCSELSPVREREKETCMYRSKCNCRLDLHVCMLRYTTHHFINTSTTYLIQANPSIIAMAVLDVPISLFLS